MTAAKKSTRKKTAKKKASKRKATSSMSEWLADRQESLQKEQDEWAKSGGSESLDAMLRSLEGEEETKAVRKSATKKKSTRKKATKKKTTK